MIFAWFMSRIDQLIQKSLNPRLAGGGQILPPPLSIIRDNLRTTQDIATKLSVPYRTSIWHLF